MTIEVVVEPSEEVREALCRLLPQLSPSTPALTGDALRAMIASDAVKLLVARDDEGRIVGTLTLALYRTPSGVRAWIEDVVVDDKSRGSGFGEALSTHALSLAAAAGVQTVDLTSRPSREAARRLYERLGFQVRDSAVYRFLLSPRDRSPVRRRNDLN